MVDDNRKAQQIKKKETKKSRLPELDGLVKKQPTPSKTPYIDRYTTDLTEKVRPKAQDFVAWGRQKEIRETFISLNRLEKNSPVLIGEAGVGKTAIVEGICTDILSNKKHVPDKFKGKKVRQLELSAIQGKELDHTGKEVNIISKMDGLIREFMAHKDDFILFIDEVHTIMGTGVEGSALDVANSLKPALARGEIYLLSATTPDEFMIVERDPAMERRLQPVYVGELDRDASILVLNKRRAKYQRELQVIIPEETIVAAVDLSMRYITDKMLPDKAIDVIDEACATANVDGKTEITLRDIADVIHRKKGIPMETLLRSSTSEPVDFAKGIAEVVKGQDHVIRIITRTVYTGIQGGQLKNRPIGAILLLGTTGTGKTEIAKQLSRMTYGREDAFIRLDMSEYSTDDGVTRLIGTDSRKGDLTEIVKKNPYSIVLLDEIEKASPEVWALLLQVLDDGRLTDGRGRTIDFKNTIIIGTSNVGHGRIKDKFNTSRQTLSEMDQLDYNEFMGDMEDELVKAFKRPEFINRWKVVVTNMLTQETIDEIVQAKMAVHEKDWFENHHFIMNYHDGEDLEGNVIPGREHFYSYLSSVGVDPANGARPLERVIRETLTEEIFTQLYFLGRQPDDYFLVDISLSGLAPGTTIDRFSDRRTVRDRRECQVVVRRLSQEEKDQLLNQETLNPNGGY